MPRIAPKLMTVAVGAAAAAAVSGCSVKDDNADLVRGKQLFVSKCGSCHTLARAGTKGTVGPNLDNAFSRDVHEDFGESAIRGVVRQQIKIPARGGVMPANLVKGKDAQDVAAYVASVVAQPGKDQGLLATAVKPKTSSKTAIEKDGVLTIPADPSGQLAYVYSKAQATAGKVKIEMTNTSGVTHDIAIKGVGKSAEISKGTASFTATLKPGTYQYYCTLPGHAAAGMKGTLTVK
ncbi:MAG TPA: c-type cytochrome [Solirubrobacteraceae bacterium]|nr:c-type cytochrome [Solirubrobacteraceae bacterium]